MSKIKRKVFADKSKTTQVCYVTTTDCVIDDNGKSLKELNNADVVDAFSFPETYKKLISNKDTNATVGVDDNSLGYLKVLKIAEDKYYMWYNCSGTGAVSTADAYRHLCFAHSTDGFNWVRGFPDGISAPTEHGANVIFWENHVEADVVLVADAEYPFRMICTYASQNHVKDRLRMYKSKDGVNWVLVRDILKHDYDTQHSIIVRGNTLKVYLRVRAEDDTNNRQIGVMYCDINGNILLPPSHFYGDYLYTTSVSMIDDHRELMIPTYFRNGQDETGSVVKPAIVDGNKVAPFDVDMSRLFTPTDVWRCFSPGFVDINGSQYLYYYVTNGAHASGDTREFRCAKVVWATKGTTVR